MLFDNFSHLVPKHFILGASGSLVMLLYGANGYLNAL